jgi:hypothetical protein
MARSEEHGGLWQAAVMPFMPYQIRWRRSFIHGVQWTGGVIYQQDGDQFRYPSISYLSGNLLVFWEQDGLCYRSHSEDAGENWSDPMVLAYSGTFPRHIIHPHHPFLLYFFFDSAILKVARSFDSGLTWIDAAPITIETGLTPQQVDAEWSNDGSVLVSWFNGGVWNQARSRDTGLTWEL